MNYGISACRYGVRAKKSIIQRVQCCYLATDAASTTPPLLMKIKSDLKTAMKAKDTNRLNVLRALLAETTNASKTSNPYNTDIQILGMLRKRTAASKSAAEEFSAANRNDLRDKEEAQIAVLEEYASGVELVTENEVKAAAAKVIDTMRTAGVMINFGAVIKAIMALERPGSGFFEGKSLDKAEVARVVKGMI